MTSDLRQRDKLLRTRVSIHQERKHSGRWLGPRWYNGTIVDVRQEREDARTSAGCVLHLVAFDDDVDAYYVRRELRDLKLEVRPFNGRRTPNERTYQPPTRNIYRFPETHAALYTT